VIIFIDYSIYEGRLEINRKGKQKEKYEAFSFFDKKGSKAKG